MYKIIIELYFQDLEKKCYQRNKKIKLLAQIVYKYLKKNSEKSYDIMNIS